jgi:hypothetical protein
MFMGRGISWKYSGYKVIKSNNSVEVDRIWTVLFTFELPQTSKERFQARFTSLHRGIDVGIAMQWIYL